MLVRVVIFDVDDTGWGLNDRVCNILGIDISKIKNFYIKHNEELDENQKELLLEKYSDPKMFENIEWYDGFDTIFSLEQFECEVHINSNCNTQAVRETKHTELVDKLSFPDDRVILNVITDAKHKDLDDNIYILVDDSPFNITKSKATYNISLRKPWNTSKFGLETIGDKKVIFCDSFPEILEVIKELLCGAKKYERYKNNI